MKIRIREGNDFDVAWAIKRAGVPEDLSTATNMKLTLVVYGLVVEHSLFTVADNLLSINIPKEVTTVNGDYRLIFEYTLPDAGQPDGDLKCKTDVMPFRIVPFTAMADDIYTINVTSDIAFGFKGDKGDDGDDAYQIWLDMGNDGTYEDFIAYLRQPAIDAGASISELESEIQVSEGLRVSAESERDLAEATRLQSESERLAAEIIRQSNEGGRIENEDTRVQNEAERISKEGIRQSSETDRVEAEGVRVQAESERQITIQEAVTATNLANEKAGLAVTATQNANDKITEIDEVVIPNAELATQNAIDVKTDYETVVKPDMIAKANYAEEQGNYAKEQGEAVDGRISVIEDKVDKNIGWYGIEFDETIANSACRRIGSMDLHRQLPIQNRMKRCLLLDDGTVNYYLHDSDSTKKADGTDAILDGTDGQVMVEIPEHWRKFEKDGTKWRVKISDYNVSGFHFVPKAYRSAYEATVERSSLKLSSVVNMDVNFRGGNNNAVLDEASNTLLGRPATVISGTNFARYAKNRGDRWCMDVYHVKKTMDWLYYIEYANFNSQLPFNPALTAEGFKQGGLSNGVTDLNSSKWSAFNGYYPFIPMGYTNSLGNKTGVKPYDMPPEYDENIFTTNVPSYRGVENPFGHIWKWTDGLKINIQADNAGGESQLYVTEDITKFQHNNYEGYEMRGLLPRADGYISKMIMGEFGELMPKEAVGGSTTYFADYFYTSIPASGESQRGVIFGGLAITGATAGLAYSHSHYAFSAANADFGSRLCFIP